MDLKFKIENEIIGSQSHFTLKISSTSPNDIINVQKIIKNNLKEFAEKTFEDDGEGIEIIFNESDESIDSTNELEIGRQMAALANGEEPLICFSEKVSEADLELGRKIASWWNDREQN